MGERESEKHWGDYTEHFVPTTVCSCLCSSILIIPQRKNLWDFLPWHAFIVATEESLPSQSLFCMICIITSMAERRKKKVGGRVEISLAPL